MAKAIKITKDNRSRLEGDYGLEEGELLTGLGYNMIVQFGSTAVDGYLTDFQLSRQFIILEPLENGWTEVVSRKLAGLADPEGP